MVNARRPGYCFRQLLALAAGIVLAACARTTTDSIELSNIDWWKVVPKSSPTQFSTAFERYCLAEDVANAEAILRSSDYVPAARQTAVQSYVVDDNRPLVMLSGVGRKYNCAVGAEARTGQLQKAQATILKHFPGAMQTNSEQDGSAIWAVGKGQFAFLRRSSPLSGTPTLLFGIYRSG